MASPFRIDKRPFSVEPVTGIMLTDGIFDTCLRRQLLSAYLVNATKDIVDYFWARPTASRDFIVTGVREVHVRYGLKPGAATLIQWEVDFTGTPPGKKSLSVEVGGASTDSSGTHHYWDGYSDAVYFLSSTTYDDRSKSYTCTVPEGSIQLNFENSLQSPPAVIPGSEFYPFHPISPAPHCGG